jgi:hypothetical protein
MSIDWIDYENSSFNDGKYNQSFVPIKFPGYLNNEDHPFTYCHALTYSDNGEISYNWSRSDSPDLFKKNLLTASSDWRYRTQQVVYKKNKSGYRTYEWENIDWKNSIVIIGCSNTYGVGLDETETISYKLEHLTGRMVVNLGYPSGSNDLILQNSVSLLEKFPIPYALVFNWTTTDRFRYFYRQGYHDLGPWNNADLHQNNVNLHKLYTLSVYDEYNLLVKNYNIGKTAKVLWQDKTKYITLSYFGQAAHYMRADKFFEIDNGARDMIHPGHENSQQVAEYIFNRLK